MTILYISLSREQFTPSTTHSDNEITQSHEPSNSLEISELYHHLVTTAITTATPTPSYLSNPTRSIPLNPSRNHTHHPLILISSQSSLFFSFLFFSFLFFSFLFFSSSLFFSLLSTTSQINNHLKSTQIQPNQTTKPTRTPTHTPWVAVDG